jgi:hypothetical protein
LRHNLERLFLDERSEVGALLTSPEDAASRPAPAARQPGGLLGKMHAHADFDAPLAGEFLIP